MRSWLERADHGVLEVEEGATAMARVADAAVVCLDLDVFDVSGERLLSQLTAADATRPVIAIASEARIEVAVRAMRRGAFDCLPKPIDRERLLQSLTDALDHARAQRAVRGTLPDGDLVPGLVGTSAAMREVAQHLHRIGGSDVTVCLLGESGTGKELVARAVHTGSRRGRGPFVAINCAAVPSSLLESELFGHERGAFTGAQGQHRGRFEQAQGGTLFLDELGEMSPPVQAALLRTLQERTIRRVGGSVDVPVDVRIVCATHRDLAAEVRAGRFREDLYYRLVVYPMRLPPLRERREDIPRLFGHFLRELEHDAGRRVQGVDAAALDALARYDWPGNVRELRNVAHRSLLACASDTIALGDLPRELRGRPLHGSAPPQALAPFDARATLAPQGLPTVEPPRSLPREGVRGGRRTDRPEASELSLDRLEEEAIERALRSAGGSIGRAAKLLGIGRSTLYRRVAAMRLAAPSQPDTPSAHSA